MNKTATLIYCLSFGLFLITAFSCNDNLNGPGGGQSGRRDYEWTIDTISYSDKTIFRIHGSSPDDIWATARGGEQARNLFHYDGRKWSSDEYPLFVAPYSVWCFSKDNAYMHLTPVGILGSGILTAQVG